jgi:hypothetical protein
VTGCSEEKGFGGSRQDLSGCLVNARVSFLPNIGYLVAARPDAGDEANEDVLVAQNLALKPSI